MTLDQFERALKHIARNAIIEDISPFVTAEVELLAVILERKPAWVVGEVNRFVQILKQEDQKTQEAFAKEFR